MAYLIGRAYFLVINHENPKHTNEEIESMTQEAAEALVAKYLGEGGGELRQNDKSNYPQNNFALFTANDFQAVYKYFGSDSYSLNESLRSKEKLSHDSKEWLLKLDTALVKVPKVKNCTLTRDLTFLSPTILTTFLERYKINETITYSEFLSTTKLDAYHDKPHVRIVICNANKGHDLSKLNKGEQEVLYERDSMFLVKKMERQNETMMIELEEV